MTVVTSPYGARVAGNASVGTDAVRIDGRAKVRGEADFTGDLRFPGLLHAALVRSPVPHGRLVSVDASEALAEPGVVAIVTGDDLLDMDPYFGHAVRDQPILAIDRVRFAGEAVAAICATTKDIAEAAAQLVELDIEDLPYVDTVESALAPGAPVVHGGTPRAGAFIGMTGLTDGESNVVFHQEIAWGDLEAAFAESEIVVEGTYRFPAVYQYAMETHSVVASWDDGRLTVWSAAQHPFFVRAQLAELFNLDLTDVRVVVPFVGGGFGSKSYMHTEPIAACMARKTGRPVRLINDVSGSMLTSRRHDMVCHMRTAATGDGELLAREATFHLNTGAYADNGPRVTFTAIEAACSPYRWRALRCDGSTVYTHTSPAGSYRGFGAAHMEWIGELQIDDICRRLDVDRVQLRLRNLEARGGMVRPGARPLDADLVGDLERLAAAIGWNEPLSPDEGIGVAVGLMPGGARPVSAAEVRCDADGVVTVRVGTTEMGQGSRTVMAQIAAEELGASLDRVRVEGADTGSTPYDSSTGASRSTTVAGKAVQLAAASVAEQLRGIAGRHWEVAADEVQLAEGEAQRGDHRAPFAELVQSDFGFAGGELVGRGEVTSTADGHMPVFWEVCLAAAVVAIDRDTGEVRVRRIATVADVGRAINPQLVELQDEGATMQGIGLALHEQLEWVDGMLVNDSLLDYHVPTTENLPDEMICVLVENGDGPGPFGAKGVGEGAHAGAIAAVACAIADAGVPLDELPATPERMWRWLSPVSQEAAPEGGPT